MNSLQRLKIEDLQKLCDESEEETLTLEFKPCNELKVGTSFRDKTGQQRSRQRDDVLGELTKDVVAFLNSAGGTIIYGVLEKKSRAESLDKTSSFKSSNKQDNLYPEKLIDWLRDHVQPSPTVNVYRVFEAPYNPESPWYLVIEIPQGHQAYMAKDHRFYKRIGNTAQPMEQYEVVDVMNRTRAAALEPTVMIEQVNYVNETHSRLRLEVILTSTNFIAAEYGQLQITLANPIRLETNSLFPSGDIDFNASTGLVIDGEEYTPHAQLLTLRWGAHDGRIVFPGAKFKVYRSGDLFIQVPKLSLIPNPTYLFQIELFTMNSQKKKALFSIQQQLSGDNFDLISVNPSNRANVISAFWETYHLARKKIKTV